MTHIPSLRRDVGIERRSSDTWRMAVDVVRQAGLELRELGGESGYDAWEIHHLRHAYRATPSQQALDVAWREWASRRFESRRRDAGGGHHINVEGQILQAVEQPVDAVSAQDVGDFVWVGDHRSCAVRQNSPGELVNGQLGRFDVHVRVDEARNYVSPRNVDALAPVIAAESNDVTVFDGYVDIEPFLGEDGEHATAGQHEVGRLITPRDRHPLCVDDGLA
jgi:hypothetical protein